MQYQAMQDDASRGYQEFSPGVDGQLHVRKRTYSMSEGLPNNFLHAAYGQSTRPSSVGAFQVPQARDAPNVGAEGLASLDNDYASAAPANEGTKTSQPFWSQDTAAAEQLKMGAVFEVISIDEKVLDA